MRGRYFCRPLLFFLAVLSLAGCASLTGDGRQKAATLAEAHGFTLQSYDVGRFVITGYVKNGSGRDLAVYIEGDGQAWGNRWQPSTDPTPSNPVALGMAVRDPCPKVLYLARPCQFTTTETFRDCHVRYWTVSRFSEEAIAALNQSLDQAKKQLQAECLHLVGYSGGGAMAILLTARRPDVASVITIAGNLNHRMWTHFHDVTPLTDSLNPVDLALEVRDCPQVHLAGDKDKVMPPRVIQSFFQRMGKSPRAKMTILRGFDHQCCWAEQWERLLKTYRPFLMKLR